MRVHHDAGDLLITGQALVVMVSCAAQWNEHTRWTPDESVPWAVGIEVHEASHVVAAKASIMLLKVLVHVTVHVVYCTSFWPPRAAWHETRAKAARRLLTNTESGNIIIERFQSRSYRKAKKKKNTYRRD